MPVASRSSRFAGWSIVGWAALVLVASTALTLVFFGTGPVGVRAVLRLTARVSVVLFTAAFSARALSVVHPGPATRWLLANRRYVGVSFAVSHFIHLLAIVTLTRVDPSYAIEPTALVLGGLGYVFIAAMTATSFDRTAAWLGPRRWRALHTAGLYYLWGIFVVSYVPRAVVESIAYAPLALMLLAALALRIHAARQRVARGRARMVTAFE